LSIQLQFKIIIRRGGQHSLLIMTWGRRIKLYLIGLLLGTFISWLLLFKNRDRDTSGWTPESRVLKFIEQSKKLTADSTLLCKLKCNGISEDSIRKACYNGEVDFDKSQPQKEPEHEYEVLLKIKGKPISFYVATNMTDSIVRILYVNPALSGESCGCR
jgi:hypothetical protein